MKPKMFVISWHIIHENVIRHEVKCWQGCRHTTNITISQNALRIFLEEKKERKKKRWSLRPFLKANNIKNYYMK